MQELSNWLGRVEAPPELRERIFSHGFTRMNTDKAKNGFQQRKFALICG
jgi:hypothetical protein